MGRLKDAWWALLGRPLIVNTPFVGGMQLVVTRRLRIRNNTMTAGNGDHGITIKWPGL